VIRTVHTILNEAFDRALSKTLRDRLLRFTLDRSMNSRLRRGLNGARGIASASLNPVLAKRLHLQSGSKSI
jgi:hypothetical protein